MAEHMDSATACTDHLCEVTSPCGSADHPPPSEPRCPPHRGRASQRGAEYVALALQEDQRLRGLLFGLLGPHPDVADLLQEVYLQILLVGEDESRTVESVRHYAMAVTRNKALDWLRRRKVIATFFPEPDLQLEEIAGSVGSQTEDLISFGQELEFMLKLVERLPDRCREVFILRRFYGMGQKQIAKELSLSVNTVEQHLSRANRCLTAYVTGLDPAYTLLHSVLRRFTRPTVHLVSRTPDHTVHELRAGAQIV